MSKKINLQRLELLIRGEAPNGRHEELFILGYKSGIGDELLMDVLLQISDIFEECERYETNHFILGYSLGQKTHREAEDQMLGDTGIFKTNKFH